VVAIIAVLIGLLLPAVQKVREAAARTTCANNLKQQVLGLHGYHQDNGCFPSAYIGTGESPGWGWSALILPYVEQQNLFVALGVGKTVFGGGSDPAAPTALTQTRLSLFRCPTDTGPDLNAIRNSFATSNYRAVAGPGSLTVFVPDDDHGG